MEIRINPEIMEYIENIYFGLGGRQFVCMVFACISAVGAYFGLHPYLGAELVSWVCVLGAVPFVFLGFFKYHGMNAEQFVWAFIKSELLTPKQLWAEPSSLYYELLKEAAREQKKKRRKRAHDKDLA